MTRAADLAKLIAGGGSITVDDNSENLKLITTDADANVGPTLRMDRQSSSAADSDLLGKINFVGHNDAGTPEDIEYAGITAIISDASDGTEDGKLAINTIVAGTERSRIFVDAGETVLNEDSVDVDFRVESNTDANMFFVDAGNDKVGIGTNAPDHKLDLVTSVGAFAARITNNNDSSQGLQVRTSDNDGGQFILDLQSSSSATGTDYASKLVMSKSGNLGIGTTSPVAALHVIGGQLFTNTETSNTSSACHFSNVLSNGAYRIRFDAANSVVGSIQVTTSGTVYNTSSDYRLKENIVTDWDATTRLKQLKPSRFNFKVDKDKTVDGFIAHEVSSIVPEAVSGEKDAVDENGNIESQLIDQSKLVPLLTKSLQEALARIDTLEAEVAKLKG